MDDLLEVEGGPRGTEGFLNCLGRQLWGYTSFTDGVY